ncbi:cache domain-containing sensor histidine kinase [Halobacillus mangrovi]|uniref:cache domain-containing sensor histidine kinase n=1 Tax=Halobacillus mangrovi TaxID=402384 RepID=UPI003D952A0E
MRVNPFAKRKWRIRDKIVTLALLSSLIPLLIVGPFMFNYINNLVEKKLSTAAENYLSLANNNITRFVNDIENISTIIYLSNEVQSYLNYEQTSPRLYQLEMDSQDLLSNITVVTNPYINGIYVGNSHNEFLKVNRGQRNIEGNIYDKITSSPWYSSPENKEWGGAWFQAPDLSLTDNNRESLLFGRTIHDLSTSQEIGYSMISVDPRVFDQMLKGVNTEGAVLIYNGSNPLYFSGSDNIPVHEIIPLVETNNRVESQTVTFNQSKYVLNVQRNETTQWGIVSLLPYESVISEFKYIRVIILSILILSFVVALLFALLISRKITSHLTVLRKITNKMEYREEVDDSGLDKNDEIGEVGARLVELYNRNNDLNTQLYTSQIKEKEAELRALQSHINPHFLYNTLNSIYWMAMKAKAKPIANVAISLSKLFKLTLNDGSHLSTVKKEVELLNHYLQIQNIRFDNKIEVSFDVDPTLNDEQMIKLLLQPIVENAVIHGLEPKKETGSIMVKGKRTHQGILFEVTDDGVGTSNPTYGYGLSNIRERIKLFYGNRYGITVKSEEGKGTKVIITIGYIREHSMQTQIRG